LTKRNLEIPRPFKFEGIGRGDVVEEAAVEYKDWAPALQILKFENGRKVLRFCYYLKDGRLARRALYIDEEDIEELRKEIKKSPHVKKFLKKLLE
jgi:hypothetical protein